MTALRLASTELRRLTAGRLPKLAVIALLAVPLLYGSMYIYANWDPYGRMNQTPAALVVADTGVRQPNGKIENLGANVANELASRGDFAWHRTSAREAEDGVRANKYSFALTLPAGFTADLRSPGQFDPRRPLVTLTTNDANGYLTSTIADQVGTKLRASVSSQVGTEAANRFMLGFGTIYQKTQTAANGAKQLASGASAANSGAGQLATGAGQLATGTQKLSTGATQLATGARQANSGATQLSSGLSTLDTSTSQLPAQTRRLSTGADQVAAGNAKIAGISGQIAAAADQLAGVDGATKTRLDQSLRGLTTESGDHLTEDQIQRILSTVDPKGTPLDDANTKIQNANQQIQTLSSGSSQVAAGARQLAHAAPTLHNGIHQASGGAGQLATGTQKLSTGATQLSTGAQTGATGAKKLSTGATQLHTGTQKLATGSAQLSSGLSAGLGQIPHPDSAKRTETAKAIGDPVAVHSANSAPAGSYGAGLAPFFLGLATWVGAYVLFLLVRPLSSRALAAGKAAWKIAIGGWLAPAALALVQSVLLFTVAITAVGLSPVHPILTFAFAMFTAVTFVAILHALNALFGAVGKFLGLLLLILQLVSAGGTFPWQTLPAPLYPLHAVLPLGYVVDGFRQLIYGGQLSSVAMDMGVLALYLIGGLAVSVFAAYRHRMWTATQLKPELAL